MSQIYGETQISKHVLFEYIGASCVLNYPVINMIYTRYICIFKMIFCQFY